MRITGGTFRGREIISSKSSVTHPMGSRERLALFNALQPCLTGAKVLDVYAGTGALGLEALSRGATTATFVENNRRALATLRQNLSNLGITSASIADVAAEHFQSDLKYDIILADPPYNQVDIATLLHLTKYLASDGQFILSHPREFNPTDFATQSGLKLKNTKTYAAANLSTFEH